MAVPKLRALYFPYARSFDLDFVKQSILLFDQIVFVDPWERSIREGFEGLVTWKERSIADTWRLVKDDYDYLLEHGEIATVDSVPTVRQYDGLLAQAMLADRDDARFIKLAAELASRDHWDIYREKLPAESLVREAAAFQDTRFWRPPTQITSPFEYGPAELRYRERNYGTFLDGSSPFVMSVAHDYIPVACGYSVNINTALLLAELDDLIPVTDDPLALRLLELKHERATTFAGTHEPKALHVRRPLAHRQKYDVFARTVASALLSPEQLKGRTLPDIVRFKESERETFERFKLLMLDFVAQTTSQPWTNDFEAEVIRLIDTKILPESQKTKDQLSAAHDKMFGSVLQKAFAAATPTVAASVLSQLSSGQVLTLSPDPPLIVDR